MLSEHDHISSEHLDPCVHDAEPAGLAHSTPLAPGLMVLHIRGVDEASCQVVTKSAMQRSRKRHVVEGMRHGGDGIAVASDPIAP